MRDGTHDSPTFIGSGYPLITSKNLVNGTLSFRDVKYISKEDYEKISKRSGVHAHDILMSMIGTIGNSAIVPEKSKFAIKNVALIKSNVKLSMIFLHASLCNVTTQMQIISHMDGGTQKFISLEKIRNLGIFLSSLHEQQTIGVLLSTVNTLITLYQRKPMEML